VQPTCLLEHVNVDQHAVYSPY